MCLTIFLIVLFIILLKSCKKSVFKDIPNMLFNGTGNVKYVNDNVDILIASHYITGMGVRTNIIWNEYQAPIGKNMMIIVKRNGQRLVSTPPFTNTKVKGSIQELIATVSTNKGGDEYYIKFMTSRNKKEEEEEIRKKKEIKDAKDSCVRANVGQTADTIRRRCNL